MKLALRPLLAVTLYLCGWYVAAQQEVYYDQFDWGFRTGNPGDLNTGFWSSTRKRMNYLPDSGDGDLSGIVQLSGDGGQVARVASRRLTGLIPSNNYEWYARVRLSRFDDSAGERNAEIAFRSQNDFGYMLTLDGGNDEIRLRRQGLDFDDLTTPVLRMISPGEEYFMWGSAEGDGPVRLRARVATDRTFSAESIVAEFDWEEQNYVQNGARLQLIGYVQAGRYDFDFDYVSIGEVGYLHPEEYWDREGFTGAARANAFEDGRSGWVASRSRSGGADIG